MLVKVGGTEHSCTRNDWDLLLADRIFINFAGACFLTICVMIQHCDVDNDDVVDNFEAY